MGRRSGSQSLRIDKRKEGKQSEEPVETRNVREKTQQTQQTQEAKVTQGISFLIRHDRSLIAAVSNSRREWLKNWINEVGFFVTGYLYKIRA
jgi:hypothetical protein